MLLGFLQVLLSVKTNWNCFKHFSLQILCWRLSSEIKDLLCIHEALSFILGTTKRKKKKRKIKQNKPPGTHMPHLSKYKSPLRPAQCPWGAIRTPLGSTGCPGKEQLLATSGVCSGSYQWGNQWGMQWFCTAFSLLWAALEQADVGEQMIVRERLVAIGLKNCFPVFYLIPCFTWGT